MAPDLISTGEVAKLRGVTADAVLKWIKKGRLPATRTTGGHYRVARADLTLLDGPPAGAARQPCLASPGRPDSNVPRHCWEYFRRDAATPPGCRDCVVYRARIEKCYEVADLGDTIGHSGKFCQASCQECSFFRACKGLACAVLVVTADEALIETLAGQANSENVTLRFARCGYESSALVETFQPAVVVLDSALPEVRDGRLTDSMTRDPRIPGAKVIIALRERDKIRSGRGASMMPAPFSIEKIERLVRDFSANDEDAQSNVAS